jgi:two-component system response regulator AtoC
LTENQTTINLLIVSHDPAVLRMIEPLETSPAWHLETAANGWEAMERMQSGPASHALVLDIPVEDSEPIHFLRWLRCFRPDFPVVLLCSPGDAGRVREASGPDGEDMVYKPFDAKYLATEIRKRIELSGNGAADPVPASFAGSNLGSASVVSANLACADIAGKNIEQLGQDTCFVSASLIMQKLHAQAALLAKTDVPVLIVGESGAGKYTVASLIHKLSVRSGFKLVRVNCAALPEAELAAELFGDLGEQDASPQTVRGKFAARETGTILLEEIAEMPASVQVRLLQVLQSVSPSNLQDGERRSPVAEAMPARVRILATSSANLDRALAEKRLREDLYHRLSGFTLQVPPLRQRKDEMPTLLRYFMHNLSRHYGLPARGFSPGMVAACQGYAWPGNLNELEAVVKRYLVTGEQESIFSQNGVNQNGVNQNGASQNGASENGASERGMDATSEVEQITGSRAVKTGAALLQDRGAKPAKTKPESLKLLIQGIKWEAERNAIAAALVRTGWNRKAAARMLKVSYRTMLYKIEQYKMRAPQPYLSPVPAGEFSGYEAEYEAEYESRYDESKSNGEARYAKAR